MFIQEIRAAAGVLPSSRLVEGRLFSLLPSGAQNVYQER
jgi:hypothetical protein